MFYFAGWEACSSPQILAVKIVQLFIWAIIGIGGYLLFRYLKNRRTYKYRILLLAVTPLLLGLIAVAYTAISFVVLGLCSGAPALFPMGITGHNVQDLVLFCLCILAPLFAVALTYKTIQVYRTNPNLASKKRMAISLIGAFMLFFTLYAVPITRLYYFWLYHYLF